MKIILTILCATLLLTGCKKSDDPANLFDLMDGSTIIADKADIIGDKITQAITVNCDINVRNNTASEILVTVKKEVISSTFEGIADINTFCWNEMCVGTSTMSLEGEIKSKSSTLFTGEVNLETLPVGKTDVKIKYTFTEKATKFSRSVTVTYTYTKK